MSVFMVMFSSVYKPSDPDEYKHMKMSKAINDIKHRPMGSQLRLNINQHNKMYTIKP